jgi:tRNA (cmo5U34)-methyltransferase
MLPTANPSTGDSAPVDHVAPEGRWTFDEEVTEVFDNMLTRSIPQYDVMREAVFATGSQFVRPGSTIIDCGASRGEAVAPFIDFLEGAGRFVCIEASSPMADSLRQRFAAECAAGSLEVQERNLKDYYPDVDADLTLAVLTLQFIPIEHRQRVMRRIYERTAPGGALILVEKLLGADADLNQLMVQLYHQNKMRNGYTREDVDRKALSLEGVLVPVTADWNIELMRQSGFSRIDCFWRWMNFGAWIAVKLAQHLPRYPGVA